jgi:hypothetical protein
MVWAAPFGVGREHNGLEHRLSSAAILSST